MNSVGFAKISFIALVLGAIASCAGGQELNQPTPPGPGATATRPCTENPVLAYTSKKKGAKKLKHPSAPDPPPTCIEVKGDPLEIQEFFQSLAREQSWRMGENQASEDMWSFVRYFNPDELDALADTKVLIEPVKFTSGKAVGSIRTADLSGGYVRVQISIHFQGEGKSTDSTWAQPANVWPLNSKGVFEQQLVAALASRYKPLD